MNVFHVVFLSIIEGITEFLPISSTGHLILASTLLDLPQTEFQKTFEVVIQLGAIGAVILLYRKTVLGNVALWKKILTAFLPTGILGFIFYKFIKYYLLGNPLVTIASLFIGGIILIFIEKTNLIKKSGIKSLAQLSYLQACLIGLIQSLSMIPGTSRSAATIIGGFVAGLSRAQSVEFSFLLAIPTMLAATIFDLKNSAFAFTSHEFFLLILGLIGSFITAYFSIKYFLKFVSTHTLIPFGVYRILIAILFLFLFFKI